MSTKTSIEWTATVHPDGTVTPGKTWNPTTGCDKVSPGCAHCYAETIAKRLWPTTYPPVAVEVPIGDCTVKGDANIVHRPREFTDVQVHEDRLLEPLSWRKPSKVFVNSMSDLFHEDVPDAFIDQVFAVMALAPQHTFQILTKRPARMRAYFAVDEDVLLERWASASMEQALPLDEMSREHMRAGADRDEEETYTAERAWSTILNCDFPLKNVWLGCSVENQHFADERIPLLLQTPAAVRFISAEPLLGPVDLTNVYIAEQHYRKDALRRSKWEPPTVPDAALDWVIVGGESGPGARPFDLAWARTIVQQCKSAGVACFVKQVGAVPTMSCGQCGRTIGRVMSGWTGPCGPTHAALIAESQRIRDRKGGDPAEWSEDLRVRQFPEGRA